VRTSNDHDGIGKLPAVSNMGEHPFNVFAMLYRSSLLAQPSVVWRVGFPVRSRLPFLEADIASLEQ